ncbi:uncharacterized protein B0P05DRAFT_154864 [Gilbertella persicaria]|uniref:uncharacterized protein n=1 Tax=Gilbertella persicaria TaxID=101096 RepID=UPI0022209E6F|nr:uncharacterized protein B0P05DRAFT_154864 [Gilbertella persicaria]KAI8074221.1 hypothetical protein B0P05DRAFT_154864 [Gilbertella persicaria]
MSQETHKRRREPQINEKQQQDEEEFRKLKMANLNKSIVYDFDCEAYLRGQCYRLQLSRILQAFPYAILFFCGYAFTPQLKDDLRHIEEHYQHFVELGALPIAITQDQIQVQWAYATPGTVTGSLDFTPSFLLASDGIDRLITRSFKSMNLDTLELQRSVIVVDGNLHILFNHKVAKNRFFPIQSLLNCFESH